MQLIIDGDPNFALDAEVDDVLGAIVAVTRVLRERGRSVMAVKVDGEDIPYDTMVKALKEKPIDSVERVEIQSEDLSVLVDEAIDELETNLPQLPKVCHELAAVFQGEFPNEGYGPFRELATIWSHVKTRELQIANALNVDLGMLELQDKTLETHHDELNSVLEEALHAMEKKDTVVLGDLLEYELAPRAELEADIVTLLKEHAPEKST